MFFCGYDTDGKPMPKRIPNLSKCHVNMSFSDLISMSFAASKNINARIWFDYACWRLQPTRRNPPPPSHTPLALTLAPHTQNENTEIKQNLFVEKKRTNELRYAVA